MRIQSVFRIFSGYFQPKIGAAQAAFRGVSEDEKAPAAKSSRGLRFHNAVFGYRSRETVFILVHYHRTTDNQSTNVIVSSILFPLKLFLAGGKSAQTIY